jgi:hypothetical protein
MNRYKNKERRTAEEKKGCDNLRSPVKVTQTTLDVLAHTHKQKRVIIIEHKKLTLYLKVFNMEQKEPSTCQKTSGSIF